MKHKSMVWIVVTLTFGVALFIQPVAWSFERQTPKRIPQDQIFAPFLAEQENDSAFCTIQNDDGTPQWFLSSFDSGTGFGVYMDPAKCDTQPTYPFRITDVHFCLYKGGTSGWRLSPVHILVCIKEVRQGNKCLGPDTLESLYCQSFTIPIDSSYSILGRPMNLGLPFCCVNQPFFLEITYLDRLVSGDTLPSLLMDATLTPADTCNNWLFWYGTYGRYDTSWSGTPPGEPIIRATGYTNASAVEEEESGLTPRDFELYQNHPNPFNSETVIKFNLLKPSFVTVVVYNILGQKAKTLVNRHLGAGPASVSWDGKDEKGNDLASGIYFYQLKAGELTQTKRLLFLK
jgi:hypothetical protein